MESINKMMEGDAERKPTAAGLLHFVQEDAPAFPHLSVKLHSLSSK
jgi:preprotein translocase subunit Sec61beta